MPDLPPQPREDRTVGTLFTAPDGTAYRPSMSVTLTLDTYGKIRPGRGVPVRPDRCDYRRAAHLDGGGTWPSSTQSRSCPPDAAARPAPCARHVAAQGRRPVHVVAARLGHADPAITLRVYAHVLRDQAVEVAPILAAVVDQPVDSDQLV